VRETAVISPSRVYGKTLAEIKFSAIIALKCEIWWQQFLADRIAYLRNGRTYDTSFRPSVRPSVCNECIVAKR